MTLLLVFRAPDGLLLLADGRRTRTPAGTLDTVPIDDTAKKTAVASAGNAVVMAAGSTRVGDRYAAEHFEHAISKLPSGTLTVETIARACFDALQPWNNQLREEERAVWVVVVGYNPGSTEQIAYRFTLPDTSFGPQLTDEVRRDGVLAIPLERNRDVGHLVREMFGHIPPDKFFELVNLKEDDPRLVEVANEAYTLEHQPLDVVAAAVARDLPALLNNHKATFDAEGVGGTWTMYKLRPGRPVETETFPWGPHAVTD